MTGQANSAMNSILLRRLGGALIAVTLAVAMYVWTGTPRSTGPLEPVTLAADTSYVGTGLAFIAQAKGYFTDAGLNVTIRSESTGRAALEAALNGQADLATVADIPVVFAALNGRLPTVVATIFRSAKDHGIVGRKDRGIATPADLKGKRIGVTLGTSGHFALDAFLVQQKLSIGDVALRNLKPEELIVALTQGDIDAVATWLPHLATLHSRLGDNGAAFYTDGLYEITFNIAGTRDYITGHPETVKKFLRALVRAERFCKDEAEQARKIMAESMRIDAARLLERWPSYRFAVTLDQSLLLALEDETRWAVRNRLVKKAATPNYLTHVYLDGLAAVKPEAVTIIH